MKLRKFMAEMVKLHNEMMRLGYGDGEVERFNQYGFPIEELWIGSVLPNDRIVLQLPMPAKEE